MASSDDMGTCVGLIKRGFTARPIAFSSVIAGSLGGAAVSEQLL